MEYGEFFQYFSKAIIATDLPGFELIISSVPGEEGVPQDGADKRRPLPVRTSDTVPGGLFPLDRVAPAYAWDQISLEILKTFTVQEPGKK